LYQRGQCVLDILGGTEHRRPVNGQRLRVGTPRSGDLRVDHPKIKEPPVQARHGFGLKSGAGQQALTGEGFETQQRRHRHLRIILGQRRANLRIRRRQAALSRNDVGATPQQIGRIAGIDRGNGAVMCGGMFIALLDIQIVASSLQDIGGGLSAAQDDISWVQTAYLIAEIIMIPLSGWLTRVFSTRCLFTFSAAGFTLSSMLCGLAWNIQSMIVFRALQGLLGASMVPTVFTSSFYYFQGERRIYSAAVIGTIATLAPTLGPVIGGWITDTLNWHWLFYVNLVPGLAITFAVPVLVRIDEPDLALLRGADYLGIVLMAIGLGTLEYTLEEGTRWNWFSDSTITVTAWIAGISLVLFCVRSLTYRNPVVDVNLGLGSLPPARLKYASGLFNMMRNLGGAVGIAVSAAILNDKTNLHFERIAAHLTPANLPMERWMQGLTSRYATMTTGHGVGYQAAFEQVWKLGFREARTLAFADTFRTMMLAFIVVTVLAPLFKNTMASTTPPGTH